MPNGYASHADYMSRVAEAANSRTKTVDRALRDALTPILYRRECDFIDFSRISTRDLGRAIHQRPEILKPLLVTCNVAGRAIARDLKVKVNTYRPRLSLDLAIKIAEYIQPFLPRTVPVDGIVLIDKTEFIDKEIRKGKGGWEREVCEAFNEVARVTFKKRKFKWGTDDFELDVASPPTGPIKHGIDVKRVEGDLDIQKRSDEIVNKADKFKHVFPKGQFAAVVYYPLADPERFERRLKSTKIDVVVFASEDEDSIYLGAKRVSQQFGILKADA